MDKLDALLTLLKQLTWDRAVLYAFAVLVGIALYHVAETKGTTIPMLFGNSLVLAFLGASFVIGGMAWIFSLLMRRVDVKTSDFEQYMRQQIGDLKEQLEESRAAEQIGRDELAAVRRRLDKAERVLRANGLDVDHTI